jgi:hypothetical protein
MILTEKQTEFINTLDSESSKFTIENSAKMFNILSEKVYEDPIRAIIRELCCNAIDANIDANIDEPIKVFLPTNQNPSLIIEDSGIGMTHSDVLTVYKSYGKSTKSSSNKVIGALGLGGKTPLAYTQQFTLITSRDGEKNTYIIYKDDQGIPNINHVNKEKANQTGTTVEMLVKPEDFEKFFKAAIKTFVFFNTMPIIMRGEEQFYNIFRNSFIRMYKTDSVKGIYEDVRNRFKNDLVYDEELNDDTTKAIKNILSEYNADYGIIMGQIFYGVNVKQIVDIETYGSDAKFILDFPRMHDYDVYKVFHVNIGDVSIQPSREALNYNKNTIDFLRKKFYTYFENWFTNISNNYSDPKKLIKNYKKVPHFYTIKNFVEKLNKENSENDKIKFLANLYEKMKKEIFKKIYNKDSFLFFVYSNFSRNSNNYNVSKVIKKLHTDINEDVSIKRLFSTIFFEDGYDYIFILDDEKQLAKLQNLSDKAEAKLREKVTCPVAIRNRLNIKEIEKTVIVDQKTFDNLNYIKNILTPIKYSEIIVPKEAATTRTPRKKVDTSGKCYDCKLDKYIDFNDILKIAQKEPVVYELFEGQGKNRGWFYHPKFSVINDTSTKRNKGDYIDIYHHGLWIETKKESYNTVKRHLERINIKIPELKNYYYVDWNLFKKNDLINLKNFHYVNNYLYEQIEKVLPQIDNLKNCSVNYSTTICNEKTALLFINFGTSLNFMGSKFMNTEFGIEMERIVKERSVPELNFSLFKNELNGIISNLQRDVFTPKNYDTSIYNNLVGKCMKVLKENIEEINRLNYKNPSNQKINNITPMWAKYPMFSFLNLNSTDFDLNSPVQTSVKIVLDYVALIEGIK